MDLEFREVTGEEKNRLGSRLKTYKNEMAKFEQDLVSRFITDESDMLAAIGM